MVLWLGGGEVWCPRKDNGAFTAGSSGSDPPARGEARGADARPDGCDQAHFLLGGLKHGGQQARHGAARAAAGAAAARAQHANRG